MAKKKKMMFMGVDITESAECFDWRLTPSNKMNAAVSVLAENPDIEILQRLRAELIAHPKKYKDVCPVYRIYRIIPQRTWLVKLIGLSQQSKIPSLTIS